MSVTPFLMFEGKAAEAVEFYIALLGGEISAMERRPDGGVQRAAFTLRGREYRAFDSPAKHDFTFTPRSRCSWNAPTKRSSTSSSPH